MLDFRYFKVFIMSTYSLFCRNWTMELAFLLRKNLCSNSYIAPIKRARGLFLTNIEMTWWIILILSEQVEIKWWLHEVWMSTGSLKGPNVI